MNRRTWTWAAVIAVLAASLVIGQETAKPEPQLETGWYARFETSKGTIVARLLPEQAPQSVAHFAAMAEGTLEWTDATGEVHKEPYYDGTIVHKAVAGQRFEAGDWSGTGSGAPRLYVPEEGAAPIDFRSPGRLGMTRSSGRRISAVQFFMTVASQPWLTGRHPCFGEIVSGLEVALAISTVRTYPNGKPIDPVTIERVRVFTVGEPPPLPEPKAHRPRALKLELREHLKNKK